MKFRIFVVKKKKGTVDMSMQMSDLMMSSHHNFPLIFFTEITKITYVSYEKVKLAFYPI